MYSRYGMEYLMNLVWGFTDEDANIDGPLDVGSYKIDLDYLIYQKQKQLNQDRNNFISRSIFNK